ncbi:MAG: nucleoside hydrolase, partial [Pseudomonas sp.]|nr:nucleoside hydrolase [Pseudomonas sp.]
MQRRTPTLRHLFRSVLLLSVLTAASAQAAEKIDLIIDT